VKTECTPKQLEFDAVGRRKLVAAFDAEHISSDGGLVLLHRLDQRFGLMRKFAACFRDFRDPDLIHHSVEELVRQRVFGIACGYEDLVDHAALRHDPLLAAVVGKADPARQLASPSTLNRLELTPADATAQARYRKVVYDAQAIEHFFVDAFLDAHRRPLREVVLDLDATDDPIHGRRKAASSTATTAITATCRSTSSPETSCCARSCAPPASTRRRAHWRRCSALLPAFARAGPPHGSCCVRTLASPEMAS
jgi:hypothetical protein